MTTLPFKFVHENFPLGPLTLYKIGGPARIALIPESIEDARAAYDWMRGQPGRKMILGGGSNMLISDEGFDGIVLITTGLDSYESLGGGRYRIEGGVVLDHVVREIMLTNNYAGVGGLTGIPGSVGGAVYMNAGTANGTTCELMESVRVIEPDGERCILMTPDLYGYRGQTFCSRGGLILEGIFKFDSANEDQRAIYDHYIQRRREKQPQGNCCGSVFKNPEGQHAGRLIQECGLKGTRRGGALISPMHGNFIMNDDHAKFEDILWLINLCKRAVREQFGIELREEVVIVR